MAIMKTSDWHRLIGLCKNEVKNKKGESMLWFQIFDQKGEKATFSGMRSWRFHSSYASPKPFMHPLERID